MNHHSLNMNPKIVIWFFYVLTLLTFGMAQPSLTSVSMSRAAEIFQAPDASVDSQIIALLSLGRIQEPGYDSTNLALIQEALKLVESEQKYEWQGVVLHLQAEVMLYQNTYEEAVDTCLRAAQLDQDVPHLLASHYMGLGEAYDFLGTEHYIDWDSTRFYFDRSRTLFTSLNDSLALYRLYSSYIDHYLRQGNLTIGARYADSLTQIAEELNQPKLLIEAYQSKVELSSAWMEGEDIDELMKHMYRLIDLTNEQKYSSANRKAMIEHSGMYQEKSAQKR